MNPLEQINLQQSRNEIFDDLHELIGEAGEAPFYTSGPEFYNAIKKYIKHIPSSYKGYIDIRRKKGLSTTRKIWFRELFDKLETSDVAPFINSLSTKHVGDAITLATEERKVTLFETAVVAPVVPIEEPFRIQKAGIYVSYPWTEMELMDDICRCLEARGLQYYRDVKDCGYRRNIQTFEEQIADGKYVIAVINLKALESIDCMYEMCTLVMNGHPEQRLFPIVDFTSDINRDSETCSKYMQKWNGCLMDKSQKLASMVGDRQVILDELNYLNRIVAEFPKFWNYLIHHNTLSMEDLKKNDWKALLDEVERNVFL